MDNSMRNFDSFRWMGEILDAQRAYLSFLSLGERQQTLYEHFANTLPEAFAQQPLLLELWSRGFVEEISKAQVILRRQGVVLAITYFEIVLDDLIECIFESNGVLMYNFLGKKERQKYANSEQRTKEDTVQPTFDNIPVVEKARYVCCRGKLGQVVERIEKYLDIRIPPPLLESIYRWNDIRNKAVHENSQELISKDDVKVAFQTIMDFVDFCEEVAGSKGISKIDVESDSCD